MSLAALSIGLIAAALAIVSSTHPVAKAFVSRFHGGSIVLFMPSTVERGEEGEAHLFVIANESDLPSLRLYAMSSTGELWTDANEPLQFEPLRKNERSQKKKVHFQVPDDILAPKVSFKLIDEDREELEFLVPLRPLKLKRYWMLLTILGGTIGAGVLIERFRWIFQFVLKGPK